MASIKSSFKALAAATILGVGTMTMLLAYHDPAHHAGAGETTATAGAPPRMIHTGGSFALVPGQTGEIGPIHIVFRGLARPRHLRMDVTIPRLDPAYAYPYTIDTTRAKAGFTMAGQRFRLLSAKQSAIRLQWMGPSLG